jgi:hypothetical protein
VGAVKRTKAGRDVIPTNLRFNLSDASHSLLQDNGREL